MSCLHAEDKTQARFDQIARFHRRIERFFGHFQWRRHFPEGCGYRSEKKLTVIICLCVYRKLQQPICIHLPKKNSVRISPWRIQKCREIPGVFLTRIHSILFCHFVSHLEEAPTYLRPTMGVLVNHLRTKVRSFSNHSFHLLRNLEVREKGR